MLDPVLARIGYIRFDVDLHYAEDDLFTVHNDDFRRDPQFQEAYARGVQASWGVDPGRPGAFMWLCGPLLLLCGLPAILSSAASTRVLSVPPSCTA